MKKQTVTVYSPVNEILVSQYGRTTYIEWCKKEIKRMQRMGRAVRLDVVDMGLGQSACAVVPVKWNEEETQH